MTHPIAAQVVGLLVVVGAVAPSAQDIPLTATLHRAQPPEALARGVAEKLSDDGVRAVVARGPVTIDFWWVSALPLSAGSGDPSWKDVEEGSLIGAVNISAEFRDVRGRVLKPGVYTLRYGIQPANGDHLGVSPFREFLLLSPAAVDTDPTPHGHEGTIELSKQAIGGSHPGVWSIDPPVATEPPLQLHKTELDHDAVVMEVPVSRDGRPAGALRFGVVLIGRIEA